jgi:hypothetical protein
MKHVSSEEQRSRYISFTLGKETRKELQHYLIFIPDSTSTKRNNETTHD